MKKLMKRLEDVMVAVTFAEAGEYDEAMRIEGSVRADTEKGLEDYKRTALENSRK
jgi:hypothetical protein